MCANPNERKGFRRFRLFLWRLLANLLATAIRHCWRYKAVERFYAGSSGDSLSIVWSFGRRFTCFQSTWWGKIIVWRIAQKVDDRWHNKDGCGKLTMKDMSNAFSFDHEDENDGDENYCMVADHSWASLRVRQFWIWRENGWLRLS